MKIDLIYNRTFNEKKSFFKILSPLPPTGFRRLGPDKTGRNSCIPVFCLRADRGGQRMNFRIIRRAPCAILTCIAIYESLQRPMKVETEIAAGFFWEY